MFKITYGKGFHITFNNGITLSTQFGYGNYCDNRMNSSTDPFPDNGKTSPVIECKNAEIAIWDRDDNWITQDMFKDLNIDGCDDVLGWVTTDQWFKILEWCKNREEK